VGKRVGPRFDGQAGASSQKEGDYEMSFISDDLRQVYGKAGFNLQYFGFSDDDNLDDKQGGEPAPVDPSGQGGEPQGGGQDPLNQMVSEFIEDGQPFDGSQLPPEVRSGIQKVLEKASPYRKLAKKFNIDDPTQIERMISGYQAFNSMTAQDLLARLAKIMGPQMAVDYIAQTYGLNQDIGPAQAGGGAPQAGQDAPLDYAQIVEQALGENAEYLDDITKKSLAATMKAMVDLSEQRLLAKVEEKFGKNLNDVTKYVEASRHEQYVSSVRSAAEKVIEKNRGKIPNTITAEKVAETAIRIGANPREPKQMELALLAAIGEQHSSILDATMSLVSNQKTSQTQEKIQENLKNISGNILKSGAPAQPVMPVSKKSWRTLAEEIAADWEQSASR